LKWWFSLNYFVERTLKFQEKMKKSMVDYSIIFNSRHIYYFTGTAQHSILLIPSNSEPILFVRRDFDRAKKECVIKDLVQIKSTKDIFNGIKDFDKKELLIGIEYNFLRVGQFFSVKKELKKSKFVDISSTIQELRIIKDDLEKKLIRNSAKISEKVQQIAREYLRPGITELELAGEIQREITKYGSIFSYFDGYWARTPFIIASGENLWARSDFPPVLSGVGPCNAEPHGPSNRVIKSGDIVVVDVATVIEGYTADHSRTYYVGNKISDKFKKIHNILLKARLKAINFMQAGNSIAEFCKIILKNIPVEFRDYLQGYDQFKEGFGHGIGLCLDELPFLILNTNQKFQKDMVVAFEPKIIIPGWGAVNFEDDFIINREVPPEQITNSPIYSFS